MVLRLLLAGGEMTGDEIAGKCSGDKERVLKILTGSNGTGSSGKPGISWFFPAVPERVFRSFSKGVTWQQRVPTKN